MGATDVVVEMFEKVKMREPLEPADAALVETLHKLSNPETPDENIFDDTQNEAPAAEAEPVEEETFELEEDTATTGSPSELIEDITDDEFEALLDELHGKGQFGGEAAAPATPPAASPAPPSESGGDEEISDDEFEALLDQLHGQGKGPGVGVPKADKPAEKPRVKVENTQPEPAKTAAKAPAPAKAESKPAAP